MHILLDFLSHNLNHSLKDELRYLENEDEMFWSRIPQPLRIACKDIRNKKVEAIHLALDTSSFSDKYETLFWISGQLDEPLHLSNGSIYPN